MTVTICSTKSRILVKTNSDYMCLSYAGMNFALLIKSVSI